MTRIIDEAKLVAESQKAKVTVVNSDLEQSDRAALSFRY